MSAVPLIDLDARTNGRRTSRNTVQGPSRRGSAASLASHTSAVRIQPVRGPSRVVPECNEEHNEPPLLPNVRADRGTDQVLVVRAQAGEQIAFELLVRKHQSRVIQLVQRFVGEADAPDVAQECFIKAYRALGSFRGQSTFFTWLYRVAVNCAKNHLVARSRPSGHSGY